MNAQQLLKDVERKTERLINDLSEADACSNKLFGIVAELTEVQEELRKIEEIIYGTA